MSAHRPAGEWVPRTRALELARLYPAPAALTSDEAVVFACELCGVPYTVMGDRAQAGCLNPSCPRLGWLVNVTGAADAYAALFGDPNPAGPRPVREGLPVPWVTPVIGRLVLWRFEHGDRLAAAQQRWLCNQCGGGVDEVDGHAVVELDGRLPTAAPTHVTCGAVALARCPALAAAGAIVVRAGRAAITGLPYGVDELDEAAAVAARRPVLELPTPSREWYADMAPVWAVVCR